MKIKIDQVRLKVPHGALGRRRGEDLARSVAEGLAGVANGAQGRLPRLSLDDMCVQVSGARAGNCGDAIRAAIRAELEKAMRER